MCGDGAAIPKLGLYRPQGLNTPPDIHAVWKNDKITDMGGWVDGC